MHRTEGENNVGNMFTDGPPGTTVEEDWLNAVQEEIIAVLTATGINPLPASADTRNQLWKAIFNIDKTKYATDVGASDDYVITLDPIVTAYFNGMLVNFKANTANTGAATLNINALGAKSIKKLHDRDLETGDIESGQIITVIYDGTYFQMQSQLATGISGLTNHAMVIATGPVGITTIAAMTNGQLVVGATGADPAPQTMGGDATLAADGVLTIANLAVEEGMLAALAVTEGKLAASAVAQAKLKTSQGSVSGTGGISNYTLPGGEYGFYPQVKKSAAGAMDAYMADPAVSVTTSYVTNIALGAQSANTAYAQQRYVTASGEVFWIFILRDKITKKIRSMWQAPDHPCFGNGGKPLLVPHPFGDFDKSKYEIIVINPSKEELAEMRAKCIKGEEEPNLDLLQVIEQDYDIDEDSNPVWPTKEVTVGLPPDYDEAWLKQEPVTPIKKVIPKPDYALCRRLKKKEN